MDRKVSCLWKEPGVTKPYRTAVSLHGHTNHSKESLYFIAEFAGRHWPLRRALAAQEKRARVKSAITVDFCKAYWTPPMPALPAFRKEREQIEEILGLASMISLTDHDNIEAPMLLRVIPEARQIPVSLEWTVPFSATTLHLGLHNLPSGRADSIMSSLQEYTRTPREDRLPELLRMLDELPDVLIVLNHPMWDLGGVGKTRHALIANTFMAELGMFIHALELGGLRSWEENQAVVHLAEGWNQPVISGGDRHGREPSAVLNLTEAESFSEFVHQIRKDRRSHVLFMPQYAEPFILRIIQTVQDVIREYPDYSSGSRQWDERVFHADHAGTVRPLASLWNKPPSFIEATFSLIRLLEVAPLKRAMQFALAKPEREMQLVFSKQEIVS